VAVRAPVRSRGHGAGRRTRHRCVAERATALKAEVLHVRAWNQKTTLGETRTPVHALKNALSK